MKYSFLPVLKWVSVSAFSFFFFGCQQEAANRYADWSVYGGGKDMIRYSSLSLIDTENVGQLKPVWEYHTGDADTAHYSQIQCNPIVVDGILYGVSAQMKLFAVDAATGKEKWVFDPNAADQFGNRTSFHIMINSRGVAYWSDEKEDKRIFFTAGSHTFAIDALSGKPVRSFGDSGKIDLHDGLDRDVKDLFVVNTSPGTIYKDLLIMGTRVDESPPSAPGHIRAFDVRTGKLVWIFHTIPQPGEPGYETWENPEAWKYMGGANAWNGFALDEARGILFVPTGSAAYDFYGGKRKGANLYANSLVALDAATGKYIWHFQIIHHDLWDKDLPTPPALVTLNVEGKKIDAVVQPTKHGMLYIFDRVTGKPVYEIQELPVDTLSELEGEQVWPSQPIPTKPAPFVRQNLTNDDINPYVSDSVQLELKKKMQSLRKGSMFIPPGKKPSLIFPGYDGGAEWGGPSFDPQTGVLYVNANEMAWIMELKEASAFAPPKETKLQAGRRIFMQQCAICHGADRKGTGNNPSIVEAPAKYQVGSLMELLDGGRRMMPAFKRLSPEEKEAIASFVLDLKAEQSKDYVPPVSHIDSINIMPYLMTGYNKFLTPEGYPAISPPWGTLNAINLNTGELVWKTTLGEYEELKSKGVPPTGTENYGGPVVTAGGLVFIAASSDGYMRAFNKANGKLLWEYKLPSPGFATPAVYELNGKQYIVIACGGGKLGTVSGDSYIAFGLGN